MKYTNKIGSELVKIGFEFSYTHKDSEIEYDVYSKSMKNYNFIKATVDITNKEVVFFLQFEGNIKIDSKRELNRLIKLTTK